MAVLALGIHVWRAFNRAAEMASGAERNERWLGSPEQRRFNVIYGEDQENA